MLMRPRGFPPRGRLWRFNTLDRRFGRLRGQACAWARRDGGEPASRRGAGPRL